MAKKREDFNVQFILNLTGDELESWHCYSIITDKETEEDVFNSSNFSSDTYNIDSDFDFGEIICDFDEGEQQWLDPDDSDYFLTSIINKIFKSPDDPRLNSDTFTIWDDDWSKEDIIDKLGFSPDIEKFFERFYDNQLGKFGISKEFFCQAMKANYKTNGSIFKEIMEGETICLVNLISSHLRHTNSTYDLDFGHTGIDAQQRKRMRYEATQKAIADSKIDFEGLKKYCLEK